MVNCWIYGGYGVYKAHFWTRPTLWGLLSTWNIWTLLWHPNIQGRSMSKTRFIRNKFQPAKLFVLICSNPEYSFNYVCIYTYYIYIHIYIYTYQWRFPKIGVAQILQSSWIMGPAGEHSRWSALEAWRLTWWSDLFVTLIVHDGLYYLIDGRILVTPNRNAN